MSEGDGGTYQPVDQNQIDAMRATPGISGFMGNALNAMTRAADNAALASAQSAGGSMTIDPDQVDKLAQFFRDEAQALMDRQMDGFDAATYAPPGQDPVSTQSSERYSLVITGDGRSYLENCQKLADAFTMAADNLQDTARQTRLDDQNAADSMRGGNLA
ncbi:hypothetical protein [Saccharopolyspora sp. NPDC002686]|uniref:hypothetical protein n=1 Tax=Saccharopolyspora sp. NPDC002686 TaxID=3154541 RepID=UPI0033334062